MGQSIHDLAFLAARAKHNISLMEMGIEFLDLIKRQLPHATDEELDHFEDQVRVLRDDLQEYEEDSAEFAEALDARDIQENGAPAWYQQGLDEGREGSQWQTPATPPRPTTNDAPPNQKSKYQRAKERGYYQCIVDNCNKRRASHSRYCRKHGGKDQQCVVAECTTRARHGRLCKKHADPQSKPQCEHQGCDNIAQSKGLCHSHNPDIRKCQRCRIVRPKYSSTRCSRCYGPRASSAESLLRPLITGAYQEALLNRRLTGTLRPDVTLFTAWGGVLCIEIDELSHTLYTAEREVARELKIAEALDKPVVFLRLNPDPIKDQFGHTIRLGLRQRFAALMEEVNELMVKRPRGVRKGKPFTILLYYSYQREQEIVRARRAFNI